MPAWLRRLLGRQRPEERLMALPGVVSVGRGLDDEGAEAILVGVESDAVPGVPQDVDGTPVVVHQAGRLRAEELPD